jgi:hypothetical protein
MPLRKESAATMGETGSERRRIEQSATTDANLLAYYLRRSFRPPLLVGFPEGHKVIHFPESIRDASGHSRGHAKCTMNFDEVVGEIK